MISLYHQCAEDCSKIVTNTYSTSFSLGIKMFAKPLRSPIYSIYGFVRFADEIVDTFHDWDKAALIKRFREDTYRSIEVGISLNPVLHAFQSVVHRYNIEQDLIDAFLDSMEMDLDKISFDSAEYKKYIYGSAEVVGLMCLRVFVDGDEEQYQSLRESACSLGSAFQKVNFLRDIQSDYEDRGRVYFPGVEYAAFSNEDKEMIEDDIKKEFDDALQGIKRLPTGARLGVYVAYVYYSNLLKRIQEKNAAQVKKERTRVPDLSKILLLLGSSIRYQMGYIR